MAVAKITGQGLATMAILVALLWACAIGELLIVARANTQADQAMRAMRSLQIKKRRQPSSTPVRPARRRLRAALS